uniref:Uncharacterized protein n=1 Tax=Arundo donax TaxID=35708 RepID=A0A0A9HUY0_ARUDO
MVADEVEDGMVDAGDVMARLVVTASSASSRAHRPHPLPVLGFGPPWASSPLAVCNPPRARGRGRFFFVEQD